MHKFTGAETDFIKKENFFMNNDGRKIYNSERERRRKQRRIRGFLSLVFTVTIVFGIGVIGFNIAKPVLEYFNKDDDDSNSINAETTDEPVYTYEVLTFDTEETENSSVKTESGTDKAVTSSQTGETSSSDKITETSESTEKNPNETSEVTTTGYSSLEPDTGDITPAETTVPSADTYKSAYHMNTEDLENISNLKSALSKAVHQTGCTTVIVPLKQAGGYLYYASEVSGAKGSGAVKGNLTLSQITEAIKAEGLNPVAEVSTLNDNVYSQVYTVASYKFADDGTTSWWDNSQEKGGKPWLSPFSDYSKKYLSEIASEIASAGFSEIICTEFVFPPFRDSDVEILGDYVVSSDRYQALLSVAYAMNDAVKGKSKLSVSFSAYDAIKGNAEILAPSEMNGLSVTPVIDISDFSSSVTNFRGESFDLSGGVFNKAVGIIKALESVCDGVEMTPCFKRDSVSDDDFIQVVKAVKALGYDICYFS